MVTLVDVSTAEDLKFPMEYKDGVTAQEFFAYVGEKLTRAVTPTGKSVRVASATVGTTPINVGDEKRSLHYYLLDGEPLYIQTELYDSTYTDLYVTEISEVGEKEVASSYCVPCKLDKESVRQLKLKLAKMTGRQANSFHIFFKRRELEDENLLSRCVIDGETVLECMTVNTRQRLFYGTPYINIAPIETQVKRLQQIVDKLVADDSEPCPAWRRATPGMWLEGVCTNHICPAYSQMVIMNQGFTSLDFATGTANSKCPICYSSIVPLHCGFSRCKWRTVGEMKPTVGERQDVQVVVKEDWRTVSKNDHYMMICPDSSLWSSFKVISKELTEAKFCVVCMSRIVSDAQTVKCGHTFHRSCLRKVNSECLQCFGRQAMTAYQLLFR